MKQSIWKFALSIMDYQKVVMPVGAKILCVQNQNEIPCLWALVDTEAKLEVRHIEMFGTGQEIPTAIGVTRTYISTFQLQGGSLVYHAFEYTGL